MIFAIFPDRSPVEIYLKTGEWRCDAEYNRMRMHGDEEGLMIDRKFSRKLKGKVLDSCVVPASINGLETVALSEHKGNHRKNNISTQSWI